MKKIFISQPMKDKTDEFILAEREKAIESAKNYFNDEKLNITAPKNTALKLLNCKER